MAYDFPASPTIGQIYQGYTWDGEKWTLGSNPIPAPATAVPLVESGTGAVGGSLKYAKEDHVHPLAPGGTGAVRYDVAQGLTGNQQSQARSNTGTTKKNYIINGAMMVSQENGATVVGAGAYPVDQWYTVRTLTTGTYSVAQVSAASTPPAPRTPAGSSNRIRLTVTAAQPTVGTSAMLFDQKLEGLRVADLSFGTANAKNVTVQLGIKSPVAGTFIVALYNNGETAGITGLITVAAGEVGVDVVKSVVLAGPTSGTGWSTDNTVGIEFLIYLVNASQTANVFATNGNVFELFDVGLYEGNVAPPFMVPDYASELAECQRYFCSNFPIGTQPADNIQGAAYIGSSYSAGGVLVPNLSFPVMMRSAPTITTFSSSGTASTPTAGQWQAFVGGTWINGTGTGAQNIRTDGFGMAVGAVGSLAGSSYYIQGSWKAAARL